jgi:C4-dicarboxylate-specific signal transduction histidine kinase
VLLNLLVNAMDAMANTPEAMRRIVVETAPTERHTVEVRVADRGSGIALEKLAEIFEPFRTTKPYGMGMGLSIVRFIVRAHGGNITAANNEDGPGAVFRFELPSTHTSTPEPHRAFARRASNSEISSAS